MTYLAFGDSITYGAEYARNYSKMDEPYPELVAKALGIGEVKNLGVSGATLVKDRVGRVCMTERILAYQGGGDIISILLGVNDYQDASPLGTPEDRGLDTVWGALDSALCHLSAKYPNAKIFIMTPYKTRIKGVDGTVKNKEGYNLPEVADAVRAVAARYSVPVLDLYNDGGYEDEIGTEGSDGIHPSQSFIRSRTAPTVADFIASLFRE